jgi:signal peptidase I
MRQMIRALLKLVAEPALTMLFVFFATTAIAQPFYVPSGSMEPTLQIGDALLGSKYAYGYSRWSMPLGLGPASETRLLGRAPRRGDVVVFRLPRDTHVTYVKRVVGLPGDRIQMRQGHLFINGVEPPLRPEGIGQVEDEQGLQHDIARFTETLPGGVRHVIFKRGWTGPLDDTPVFLVPAGHYFMMGDNRDNSLDSRVPQTDGGVGFVPAENLVARADVTLVSYDFLSDAKSWLGRVRASRFFKAI